jgi:hypothetical protein
MKKYVLCTALALFASVASAADMPVKAPLPFSTNTGSGWYCGLGTQAGVAQTSMSGNSILATSLLNSNVNAAGGAVGGGCGWITNRGPLGSWMQFEADGWYQNISATAGPVSVASRWSSTQEADIGIGAFSAIQAAFAAFGSGAGFNLPFPSFTPTLPTGVAVNTAPRQYVGLKMEEFGLTGNFAQAGGAAVGWAPGLTTGFRWQTLDATGKPNDGSLKVYADVFWPQRGDTFSNVLGTNGNVMVSGAAKFTTQYWLGLKYDFGL